MSGDIFGCHTVEVGAQLLDLVSRSQGCCWTPFHVGNRPPKQTSVQLQIVMVLRSRNHVFYSEEVLKMGVLSQKYHKMGGPNNKNSLSHTSRIYKSKVKLLSWLFSGETSRFLVCKWPLSHCVFIWPLFVIFGMTSSSYKDSSPIGLVSLFTP
jgi:hypothetical protein